MKIWRDIKYFEGVNPVVTIGIFDGVHKGHKFLLNELRQKASELKGESVVLTLWPHPRAVLGKDLKTLRYLSNIDEKSLLLKEELIDHLVVIPFTREFADLDSCSFVEEYLVNKLHISHLLVGYNHRFGKDRQGDIKSLKTCADRYGFTVNKVNPLEDTGERISSSLIRDLLFEGEILKANSYLGYKYFLIGSVVEGNKIGRQIGFPTANIQLSDPNKLLPKVGVYAVRLSCEGKVYNGMMNIGYRPTIENSIQKKTIEVNLFDSDIDLYGKKVAISFEDRMRNEQKFNSLDELTSQLNKDKKMAVDILNKKP